MNRKVLMMFSIFALGIISCKKEGCRVFSATNYDSKAKKADDSCQFSGSTYTSIGTSAKNNLLDDGHDFLEVYIDGSLIGTINVNAYTPNGFYSCSSSNVATKSLSWVGGSGYKSFQVDYRNQSTGVLVKSTSVTVNGNSCNYSVLSY